MRICVWGMFVSLFLAALFGLNLQPSTASAQGTAFFYPGQLQNNGSNTSGNNNTANDYLPFPFKTSGINNTANGIYALCANTDGSDNTANGFDTLANNTGGSYNTADGVYALFENTAGYDNTADGDLALYHNTSGCLNTADGVEALFNNTAGNGNIALGIGAGSEITTNSNNIDIGNCGFTTDNNIIRIGTQGQQTATYLTGTVYANGVALSSDRNAKEHFTALDPQAVLAKVEALPISEWQYKADSSGIEHLGPMAQDFHAAFGLNGADDKHISVVDENGVALAAIKGLNEKLESDNAQLKQENNFLAKRLDALEAEVKTLSEERNNNYVRNK